MFGEEKKSNRKREGHSTCVVLGHYPSLLPTGPSLKHRHRLHAVSAPSQDRTDRSSAAHYLTPGRGDYCFPSLLFTSSQQLLPFKGNRAHLFTLHLQQRGIQRKKEKKRTKVTAQAFTWVAPERLGSCCWCQKVCKIIQKKQVFQKLILSVKKYQHFSKMWTQNIL